MLDERSGSIVLPPGVARYYMITFISFLERERIENLAVYGDRLEIRTTTGSVAELLADGINQAASVLEEYYKRHKVEIPASGNDKKIFASLMKSLSLPEGGSFTDALKAYSNGLRSYEPKDIADAFSRFGKGEFSLPSIFKPEQYALSRAPFMKGEEKFDVKVNLDYFMVLLAGYVLSRWERVRYERGGELAWHTLHVFPYDIGVSSLVFRRLLKCLSQEGGWGRPPGLRPEEAVILWLVMSTPDDVPDIILMSIKDPGGQKATEIDVSYDIPLSSFIARSGRALRKIKEDEEASKDLKSLLIKALTPADGKKRHDKAEKKERDKAEKKGHDRAVELVKLLFIALQGGELQRAELLLRASRVEASKIIEGEKDEEYWVARWGHNLAKKIALS